MVRTLASDSSSSSSSNAIYILCPPLRNSDFWVIKTDKK